MMCSKPATCLRNGEKIVRLLPVIELAQQALAKLVEHLAELVALSKLGVVIEELRDLIERIEVFDHRLANSRTLHFHGDLPAIAQDAPMHLAERGRRHRRDVEIGKRFRHTNAELGRDDLLDFVERERLDFVLQPGERFEVSAAASARRGWRAAARVSRTSARVFRDRPPARSRFGRFFGRDALLGCQRFLEPAFFDQIGATVLRRSSHAIWR